MINRRKPGHGTIERLPSGRFRARAQLPDGNRHDLGTHDTYEEAEAMIAAAVDECIKAGVQPVGATTLKGIRGRFLEDLERSGYVCMPQIRSSWDLHIETATFADWSLARVTDRHIKQWVKSLTKKKIQPPHRHAGRTLSRVTIRQALNQVRRAYDWAIDEGLTLSNPTTGVRIPRGLARTEEPWTYLTPAEQRTLLTCKEIPEAERMLMGFAIGTGMRQGEIWNLELRDLHVDGADPRVFVRFGSKGRAPKGRRMREVPLFGLGLDCVRRWLELLPHYANENPHGLVFPTLNGNRRRQSMYHGWHDWLKAAGIKRRVRFHDLRHTCAASLISGWWGRPWRLEEIRDLLGHSSIKVTEMYAHLGPTVLKQAALETRAASPRGTHAAWPAHQNGSEVGAAHAPCCSTVSPVNSNSYPPIWTALGHAETHAAAVALLRGVAAGRDVSAELRRLALLVLEGPPVRLASAALAGGAHAIDRALELVDLIIPDAAEREALAHG